MKSYIISGLKKNHAFPLLTQRKGKRTILHASVALLVSYIVAIIIQQHPSNL